MGVLSGTACWIAPFLLLLQTKVTELLEGSVQKTGFHHFCWPFLLLINANPTIFHHDEYTPAIKQHYPIRAWSFVVHILANDTTSSCSKNKRTFKTGFKTISFFLIRRLGKRAFTIAITVSEGIAVILLPILVTSLDHSPKDYSQHLDIAFFRSTALSFLWWIVLLRALLVTLCLADLAVVSCLKHIVLFFLPSEP